MRLIARIAIFGILIVGAIGQALAQDYPRRPIRLLVPFLAGGPSDILARVIAQKMSENWGQQVLVDNRPGANTLIAAEAVAKAAPDGYTILMAIDSTLVMNQGLYNKLPYDPIKDFAPITVAAWSAIIIAVDAAKGPKSIQELIQQAKASPGKVTYATATITTQLGVELMKKAAGVSMVHVPYKGSAGNLQALLGGEVNFVFDGVTPYVPYIRSGKLRVLANVSSRPISALPDAPRLSDVPGFSGFDVVVWLGLVAPAGTPADIVSKLHQEVVRIYTLPDAREKLQAAGLDPAASASPAEFAAFINREVGRWAGVIKESGIRFD